MSPFLLNVPSELKFWRRHCSTVLERNSCMKFCPRFRLTKILELLLGLLGICIGQNNIAQATIINFGPSPLQFCVRPPPLTHATGLVINTSHASQRAAECNGILISILGFPTFVASINSNATLTLFTLRFAYLYITFFLRSH